MHNYSKNSKYLTTHLNVSIALSPNFDGHFRKTSLFLRPPSFIIIPLYLNFWPLLIPSSDCYAFFASPSFATNRFTSVFGHPMDHARSSTILTFSCFPLYTPPVLTKVTFRFQVSDFNHTFRNEKNSILVRTHTYTFLPHQNKKYRKNCCFISSRDSNPPIQHFKQPNFG